MGKMKEIKRITKANSGWYIRINRAFAEANPKRDVLVDYPDKNSILIKRIDLEKVLG